MKQRKKDEFEREHDRMAHNLAKVLRQGGDYLHVVEFVNYKRGDVQGEVDVLAVRQDRGVEFYEVKTNSKLRRKAQSQYVKFKGIFGKPSTGYMVSPGFIRRLK